MTTLSDHPTMPVSSRTRAALTYNVAVNPDSQEGKVLLHLIRVGRLTQLQALELYRVHRLASRISALKLHYGLEIMARTKRDATGTRYTEYSL